jgi:putative membrane protein
MRDRSHLGSAHVAAVVAALALAGCGGGNAGADSVAVGTATDTAAGTTVAGAGDSAALGIGGASGNLSPANVASLVGLTNASEIGAAKVARDKGTNGDVKDFATQMIHDHEGMQKSLDSLAQAKAITPQAPAQADAQRQQDSQTMATLNGTPSGAAFDKAYVDAQVQAHQKALNDLQSFSGSTSDLELRALLDAAIPKIQAHLDRAQQIQQKLGSS